MKITNCSLTPVPTQIRYLRRFTVEIEVNQGADLSNTLDCLLSYYYMKESADYERRSNEIEQLKELCRTLRP